MPSAPANGITIEYDTSGDPSNPALLLIMGLGGQLISWDTQFVDRLAGHGFFVIRYDNRDVGKSTWFDGAGVPDLEAVAEGAPLEPAYLLSDMADDADALLEALGVASAHIVGISMGGMIAQSLAIQHPDRVRTLVSIMSTTGNPEVGQPHPEAIAALLGPAPDSRDAALDTAVVTWKIIGSPGYPVHEDRIRRMAGEAYDRGFHPAGAARQIAAILGAPDRTAGLGGVSVPTLVIHGEADPLVDPSGGQATADAIPGAQLWTIPGMGHDMPPEILTDLADRIAEHCASAR